MTETYTSEELLACVRDPSKWSDAEKMRAVRDRMAVDEGFRDAVATGENEGGVPQEQFLSFFSEAMKQALPGEAYPVLYRKSPIKPEFRYSQSGQILKEFGNYCVAIEKDDYLTGRIRLNALSGRVMLFNMYWDLSPHPIRDADLYQIRRLMSDSYGLGKLEDVRQAVEITANKHKYHPVVEFLDGLAWDGTPRIAELFPRYLGAERSEYTTAATKLLLYGAIQRARSPGIKFDYCIILADTKQGTGKSSICRFLSIRDEWFCDALGDLNDGKKAYEAIRGHWICEMSEMLATRRTRDIEAIKAYLSRTDDDYRDPYGVYPERRPRQCVFIGTTNKPQFLPDDKTGNRRFIPIICNGDKAEVHPMQNETETREYIRQCYAEAMRKGEAEGWPLTLPHELDEQLNAIREMSTPEDANVGAIQAWLDSTKEDVVCSRMIWDEAFPGRGEPTKFDLQDISEIMCTKIDGWKPYRGKTGSVKRRVGKYGVQRAWVRDVATNVATSVDTVAEFEEVGEQIEIPFMKTG